MRKRERKTFQPGNLVAVESYEKDHLAIGTFVATAGDTSLVRYGDVAAWVHGSLVYIPTRARIERMCRKFRKAWTPEERARRKVLQQSEANEVYFATPDQRVTDADFGTED